MYKTSTFYERSQHAAIAHAHIPTPLIADFVIIRSLAIVCNICYFLQFPHSIKSTLIYVPAVGVRMSARNMTTPRNQP